MAYQFQNNGGYVGTAPGTPTIQTATGDVQQVVNEVDDKYWGTAEWQSGDTAANSFFSVAGSAIIPGGSRASTPVDNNLIRPGDVGLPQAFAMDVYQISIQNRRADRDGTLAGYSDPVNEPVAFNLNRLIQYEFTYSNRIFCQGLGEDFPAGAGQFWQGSQTAREVVNNGAPLAGARVTMLFPISLREGIAWKMVGTPAAAITIAQAASDNGTNLTYVDQACILRGPIQKGI